MTTHELSLHDDKMRAEIAHLAAQTARIQQQMRWQMPVYLISFIGAVIAIVNVFG
ncbi:MAG: hypothetical protein AAF943_15730 [Pseudomonadota bacterium]